MSDEGGQVGQSDSFQVATDWDLVKDVVSICDAWLTNLVTKLYYLLGIYILGHLAWVHVNSDDVLLQHNCSVCFRVV